MRDECIALAIQAMIDYQVGRDISHYPHELVEQIILNPVIEISLEQERLIDSFGEIYCVDENTILNNDDGDTRGDF